MSLECSVATVCVAQQDVDFRVQGQCACLCPGFEVLQESCCLAERHAGFVKVLVIELFCICQCFAWHFAAVHRTHRGCHDKGS